MADILYKWNIHDEAMLAKSTADLQTALHKGQYAAVTPWGLAPASFKGRGCKVGEQVLIRESELISNFWLPSWSARYRYSRATKHTSALFPQETTGSEWVEVPGEFWAKLNASTNIAALFSELAKQPIGFDRELYGVDPETMDTKDKARLGNLARLIFDYWGNGDLRYNCVNNKGFDWALYHKTPWLLPVALNGSRITRVLKQRLALTTGDTAAGESSTHLVSSLTGQLESRIAQVHRLTCDVLETMELIQEGLKHRGEYLAGLKSLAAVFGTSSGVLDDHILQLYGTTASGGAQGSPSGGDAASSNGTAGASSMDTPVDVYGRVTALLVKAREIANTTALPYPECSKQFRPELLKQLEQQGAELRRLLFGDESFAKELTLWATTELATEASRAIPATQIFWSKLTWTMSRALYALGVSHDGEEQVVISGNPMSLRDGIWQLVREQPPPTELVTASQRDLSKRKSAIEIMLGNILTKDQKNIEKSVADITKLYKAYKNYVDIRAAALQLYAHCKFINTLPPGFSVSYAQFDPAGFQAIIDDVFTELLVFQNAGRKTAVKVTASQKEWTREQLSRQLADDTKGEFQSSINWSPIKAFFLGLDIIFLCVDMYENKEKSPSLQAARGLQLATKSADLAVTVAKLVDAASSSRTYSASLELAAKWVSRFAAISGFLVSAARTWYDYQRWANESDSKKRNELLLQLSISAIDAIGYLLLLIGEFMPHPGVHFACMIAGYIFVATAYIGNRLIGRKPEKLPPRNGPIGIVAVHLCTQLENHDFHEIAMRDPVYSGNFSKMKQLASTVTFPQINYKYRKLLETAGFKHEQLVYLLDVIGDPEIKSYDGVPNVPDGSSDPDSPEPRYQGQGGTSGRG